MTPTEMTYMEHLEIVDKLETTKCKEWYIETFPTDELGHYLKDEPTFSGLFNLLAMGYGHDVYDYIGEGDSVIRERLFSKLSDITGMTYEDIYRMWLGR